MIDRKLLNLATKYAEALVELNRTPQANANRVSRERRDAMKYVQEAQRELSKRAEEVAQGLK